MNLDIRPIHLDQRPVVSAIAKRCGHHVGYWCAFADTYNRGLVNGAWADQDLVGFMVSKHLMRKPWSSLYEVGVLPGWRRHGVGAALVDWLLAESPHHRIRLVCSPDNMGALAFYTRLGFHVVGHERTNRAGEPIVDLELA